MVIEYLQLHLLYAKISFTNKSALLIKENLHYTCLNFLFRMENCNLSTLYVQYDAMNTKTSYSLK